MLSILIGQTESKKSKQVALATCVTMAFSYLLLLFILFLSLSSYGLILINSSEELKFYLCQDGRGASNSNDEFITLQLVNKNYMLNRKGFCQVSSKHISIVSNYNAIIACNNGDETFEMLQCHYDEQQRWGLVFWRSFVHIQGVTFKGCGAFLNTINDNNVTHYINSSSLYYDPHYAAALVFVNCQITLKNVSLKNSFGFSLVGVNLQSSSINNFFVNQHVSGSCPNAGSGALIHYTGNYTQDTIYSLNVHNATFAAIFAANLKQKECIEFKYQKHTDSGKHEIIYAAGLTILYSMRYNNATVVLNKLNFTENLMLKGVAPGGLLIMHYPSSPYAVTVINNTMFEHNYNQKCQGSGFAFYWFTKGHEKSNKHLKILKIENTTFQKHNGFDDPHFSNISGAVFIGIFNIAKTQILINFSNCSFIKNVNNYKGAALNAISFKDLDSTTIVLKDIYATKNRQFLHNFGTNSIYGSFTFYGIHKVLVTGNSNFTKNYGSVIRCSDTNIHIAGNVTFSHNTGLTGAAIYLTSRGRLFFYSTNVTFSNNVAKYTGGAINLYPNRLNLHNCTLVIDQLTSNITFINNSARSSGNSIFNNDNYPCYLNDTYILTDENIQDYYRNNLHFVQNSSNDRLQISTRVGRLRNFNSSRFESTPFFPGQNVTFCLAARSATVTNWTLYTPVYSSIVVDHNHTKKFQYELRFSHLRSTIEESRTKECYKITLQVLCTYLSKTPSFDAQMKGHVRFLLPQSSAILEESAILLHPCLLGFELQNDGFCTCSQFFNEILSSPRCNIQSGVIQRPHGTFSMWGGLIKINDTQVFGVSFQCPTPYCHSDASRLNFCSLYGIDTLKLTTQGYKNNDNCSHGAVPTCLHNRTGVLCGQCPTNYSVIFGSYECKECNNYWIILSVFVFGVAGPLFIYLLYCLKLTLTTGTINGVIFYAQCANSGVLTLLRVHTLHQKGSFITHFPLLFLSILNLNLGFPLCFVNGMDELWKAGLSLLFPIYLLTIIVIVIILSQFSLKISDKISNSPVQVLVTVVHISFSKLLLAIIDVFTPVTLYTEEGNKTVWFFDGSVDYASHSHLALMIPTSIIVVFLLVPYMVILLFSKQLRRTKINKYIKPLLDAIHAPYKEGKEQWFLYQLILLIIVIVLYSVYRSGNIFYIYTTTIPLVISYLIAHAYCKPFKSDGLNLLYAWFTFNVSLIGLVSWYFLINDKIYELETLITVMVTLAFITLIFIVVYHILWIRGLLPVVTKKITFAMKVCRLTKQNEENISLAQNDFRQNGSDSFYGATDYRESLISSAVY